SVDAYREITTSYGFDTNQLPIGTTSLFYTAENTQDALHEFYLHLDTERKMIRGGGYPKQQVAQAVDEWAALMSGSPARIVEKMLYEHEVYGQQRFMAQIDFGGLPFDKIAKNIELIATKIIPEVKKHTRKQGD